jgi:tight adherence protein C
MGIAILLCLGVFVGLAVAITYFGYRHWVTPARVYEQLSEGTLAAPSSPTNLPAEPGLHIRMFQTIGEMVPISPEDATVTRLDLFAAGYRSDAALTIFWGIRLVACAVLTILAYSLHGYLTNNTILTVVIVGLGAFLGFMGPSFLLEHKVAARQEALRFALPDALDLMVVCVEAGLGMDQTIQHVSRELAVTHPELCEELALVNLEIRAGKRRMEALKNLGDRTGEPEIRKLVATLVQTERFGTGVSEALRVHSDFLRMRRRLEAEERAGKVGVKLVFPIFFLILPAMLCVAAGPGLLQVFKYLFPMMRQFRG